MRKFTAAAAAAGLTMIGVGGLGAGLAAGSSSAAAVASAQDVAWMQANAQTDLTEISGGTLAMSKSTDQGVLSLASMTKSQHVTLLAKLQSVAATTGTTLPTVPNAMEQAQAAQLMGLSGASFNITYDDDQISGHEMSISMTNYEISHGTDPAVIDFARSYLPFAQEHLNMADALHATLTSATTSPSGVVSGSGGHAGRLSPGDDALVLLGVVGLLGAAVTGRRLVRS